MDRKSVILSGIDTSMLGLEIAPWFAPLVPKSEGWNVRILDVFDRPTLLDRASADANLTGRDLSVLEEVDFVGSATEIGSLVPADLHGTFDYIVSSHNFEHLANPIRFLQGCHAVLKPGGVLVMAVPDHRHCFDFFRPNTTLGDWLDAYAENRARPTRRQRFDHHNHHARRIPDADGRVHIAPNDPPSEIRVARELGRLYAELYLTPDDGAYHDVHCTVMTPASAELLFLEARHLKLVDLEVESIGGSTGEFVIRLRKTASALPVDATDFNAVRSALLRRMLDESREQATGRYPQPPATEELPRAASIPRPLHKRIARSVRRFGRRLRGRSD